MIPTPGGPDIPFPPPEPTPGGRHPSPAVLAYKAMEELEDVKRQMTTLLARFEALERRVATLESAKTA